MTFVFWLNGTLAGQLVREVKQDGEIVEYLVRTKTGENLSVSAYETCCVAKRALVEALEFDARYEGVMP